MNDNETRVFENHAQDARVREVGEREGGGLPVYRTDRRELPVGEREQSNNHRSAGGAVMDRANREAAQTPLKGGGMGCTGERHRSKSGERTRRLRVQRRGSRVHAQHN